MAVLHLVNHSPADSRGLEHCLARAGEGDAVLLMEDAVYAAVIGGASEALLQVAAARVALYALRPDLEARGLDIASVPAGIRLMDYPGFVALTTVYNPILSWS